MAQLENAKDSKQVIVNLKMTVEEARQVIWEDAYNPRGPIGDLLDAKKIGYNNLAWGVQGAWKPEMRTAARTLLAHWLGEPTTAEATRRYGPEVVEGSHYLEKNELESLKMGSLLRGYGFGGAVALSIYVVQQFIATQNIFTLMIGLAFVFLLVGVWIRSQTRSEFARYEDLRQGRKGEESVVEVLRVALDNRWTIFRNLHLPDRKDDIDIALVGPGGVWVIEVKAFRGNVRSQNGAWERQTKRGWKKLEQNPSRQVTENAKRLNFYLQQQGITRWVERAVALAEPQPIQNFQSEISIWFLPTLEATVSNLTTRTAPTDDEIKRIVGLFKDLAAKQVAIEEAKYKKN